MDEQLRLAQVRNLQTKTLIFIFLALAVVVVQGIGLILLATNDLMPGLPVAKVAVVPAILLLLVFMEFYFYRRLGRALAKGQSVSGVMIYFVCFVEVFFPTIILYYGSLVFHHQSLEITVFMFQNSPPLLIYVLMIVLSVFHLEMRISLFSGFVAAIGYAIISVSFLNNPVEILLNLSKSPFLILTGFFIGFVARRFMQSVKSSLEAKNELIHKLDEKVKERTAEVEAKKEELEIKNKEITDSIVYAKRIQSAILPDAEFIRENLPDSFILFKPKDIVAGDFYWAEKTKGGMLFAVADCTGHGVPGAMVSVVCSHALNQSVREFGKHLPHEILNQTRELVIREFNTAQEDVKDGMDIALCLLKGKHLQYAGANNPVWIVRNDEIIELKPTKQPVGKSTRQTPFESREFNLAEGDTIYLFSDGYADQFGGEKAKKFKSSNLKMLLKSIQYLPIEQQASALTDSFETWRGPLEQVDDVCVIGIRI